MSALRMVRLLFAAWLVLIGVATAFPDLRLWGMHLPAFLPFWARVIFFALAASFLILPVTAVARVASGVPQWVRRVLQSPLAAIALVAAFILFRVSYGFLGDGMLRGREAQLGMTRPAEVLPGYLAAGMYDLLYPTVRATGQDAVAAVSILAGCLFIAVLWAFTRRLWDDNRDRRVARLLLLISTATALFFGYVESYALPCVAIVGFLLAAESYRRERGSFWPCLIFFLLAVASHLLAVALFPALLVLSATRAGRSHWRLVMVALIGLAAGAWGYWTIQASQLAQETPTALILVPLLPQAPAYYGLISPAHLGDIANLLLLVCPGILMAIPLLRTTSVLAHRTSSRLFWPLALIVPLGIPLLLDPKLGMARDWDLFSLGLVPLVVWAAVRLTDHRSKLPGHPLTLPVFASTATLVMFVAINASTNLSIARFERLLELDDHRGGYGYDILATWYQEHGQTEAEIHAWRNALKFGEHRRYWTSLAAAYLRLGNVQNGFIAAQRGYRLDTTYAYSAYYMGMAYEGLSMSDSALAYYARAVSCAPESGNMRYNFALALFRAEQCEPAIAQMDTLVHVIPDNALYWNALAMMLMDAKRLDQAQIAVDRAGELAPADVRTVMNRAALYHNTGNNDSALAEVSRLWGYPDLTEDQRAGLLELTQSIREGSISPDSSGP